MEKHEKEEALDFVSKKLFLAEREYNASSQELQGFKRVVNGFAKLGETRKQRFEDGEDVTVLDEFLADNQMRLGHLLSNLPAEGEWYNLDFDAWAIEIENDIRAQDPLMLSFDSTDGGGYPKASSSGVRDEGPSVSSKGGTLLTILKTNGKLSPKIGNSASAKADQSFFYLTSIAWVFAVFGMMVTIGFLAADFWYAQKHVAIHVERSTRQPQELPAITICNFVPNIPGFSNYPSSEYPGLPIFGIQRLTRYNQSTSSLVSDQIYPDILPTSPESKVEDVFVSHDLSECESTRGFNVTREMASLKSGNGVNMQNARNGKRCYHCKRLGLKSRIVLYPPQSEDDDGVLPPAINLKLYRTKLFAACQTDYHRRNIMVISLFVDEIQKFAEQLEGRGILDFNGEDKDKAIGVDWYQEDSQRFFDFCCNVYFFSGFFYPSGDNADISYRFDGSIEDRWIKTGSGPYYSAYTWNLLAPDISGPSRVGIEKDFYTSDALELYVEGAEGVNATAAVSPHTKVSAIEAAQQNLYRFRKILNQGNTEYEIIRSTSESPEIGQRAVDLYNVLLSFDSFETEMIVTTPTMTWPEFVIDAFEFIGLFTGICIFTLIVAPAHSLVYPTSDTEQK